MDSYTGILKADINKSSVYQNEIDINIKSIYFFLKVVECGNLTGASRELFVSQPNLSKIIQGLEERLGYALFIREKNKLILTLKGEEFYKAFYPIVHAVQENITRIKEMESPRLNIAVGYTLDFFKMREKGFINQNFAFVNYKIECLNPFSIIKKLNEGAVDTAILLKDYLEIMPDADYFEIGEIKRNIIVSPENKFAKCDTVSMEDLCNEEIVIYIEAGCNMEMSYLMAERYCKKMGLDISNITFVTNYQTALLTISSSNKIVMGDELLPSFPYPNLVSVPIKDSYGAVIAVVAKNLSEEKRCLVNELYNQRA